MCFYVEKLDGSFFNILNEIFWSNKSFIRQLMIYVLYLQQKLSKQEYLFCLVQGNLISSILIPGDSHDSTS
jgi:hypothetical protein